MHRPKFLAALVGASLLPVQPVFAHGFAGPHMFISTLLIDDPNVADEASLPTFSFLPQPTEDGLSPGLYNVSFEFDKRITENFGFSFSNGYQWLHTPGAGTVSGWQNLEAGLKYKIYVNPEHEFMLSLGMSRDCHTAPRWTMTTPVPPPLWQGLRRPADRLSAAVGLDWHARLLVRATVIGAASAIRCTRISNQWRRPVAPIQHRYRRDAAAEFHSTSTTCSPTVSASRL